jgi:hypothetical protein
MSLATFAFFAGLFGIIAMLCFKGLELKTGKPGVLARVSNGSNDKVHNFLAKIKRYISYINKKSAILLFHFIVAHIIFATQKILKYVKKKFDQNKHTKKYLDMVKGKGSIKKKGAVSIYLKQISESENAKSQNEIPESNNQESVISEESVIQDSSDQNNKI